MKKFLFITVIILSLNNIASADTYVNGYYRSDGTYVNGYYRTEPNNTRLDNYSTKGNYNPYTGKVGTINPYNEYGSSYNNNYYNSLYSNNIYRY